MWGWVVTRALQLIQLIPTIRRQPPGVVVIVVWIWCEIGDGETEWLARTTAPNPATLQLRPWRITPECR